MLVYKDFTFCVAEHCKDSCSCKRHVDNNKIPPQSVISMSNFNDGNECEYKIEMED